MSRSEDHYFDLMRRYVSELARDVREEHITPESLGRSTLLQRSVTKGIELIGEAAWQLRKLGADYGPDVPLEDIAGMRHILVHHYDGVDWNLVEEVAFRDLPRLEEALERVAREARRRDDEQERSGRGRLSGQCDT